MRWDPLSGRGIRRPNHRRDERVTIEATPAGCDTRSATWHLFGDVANLTPQLPGFVTLNLSASYRLTPHVQFFASAENVTNAKYYTCARSRRSVRRIRRRPQCDQSEGTPGHAVT